MRNTILALKLVILSTLTLPAFAQEEAPEMRLKIRCESIHRPISQYLKLHRNTKDYIFPAMDNLKIGSVSDPTNSTGATLFMFPKGAKANFDARGGSVASIETSLLTEGGYSNGVNGIIFTGGSTMGLAASDGVREVLFKADKNSEAFDAIPSIPGAVVYDYGGRIYKGQDQRVYPNRELGKALAQALKDNRFVLGKAGAGTSTTANKISQPIWGGQGAAYKQFPWGKVFVAVILNPVGNITIGSHTVQVAPKEAAAPGKNTTLSIVITDVDLTRSQLKRLSTMVHTSMARRIFPFHSLTDGDINFAVSLGERKWQILEENAEYKIAEEKPEGVREPVDLELELSIAASELMDTAISRAVSVSNGVPIIDTVRAEQGLKKQ